MYGIIRHQNHEIKTNSFENPTKFYHFYKTEMIGEFDAIGDCIKSVEQKSGDKISDVLKTKLTFEF